MAAWLEKHYRFLHVSVDDAYVNFIRDPQPDLWLNRLPEFIAPHYIGIFTTGIVADAAREAWHTYLLGCIQQGRAQADRVCVEGYLLKDRKDELQRELAGDAVVVIVKAESRLYHVAGRVMSADDVGRHLDRRGTH